MTRWTLSIAEMVQFDPGYLLAPQGGVENSTTCSKGRERKTVQVLFSLKGKQPTTLPALFQWINFFHSPLCFRLFTIVSSTATYKAAIPKANSKNKASPLTLSSFLIHSLFHINN